MRRSQRSFCSVLTFLTLLIASPLLAQDPPGQPKTDLLFILDVSGSMNSIMGKGRLIDWAQKAVESAVASLPPEAEVGIRLYGHRVAQEDRTASCQDSELLVPIGKGNGPLVAAAVQALQPKGWTPIAYSLEKAAGDFAGQTERLHTIILVSDGEETCGGDPLAAARGLIAKGYRIKIFTIGFNVNETARMQLESLAQEFGGTYSDVRTGLILQEKLTKLTQQTFLIEKKEVENRIRGGDSYESAVTIETGKRYKLDHHQRKGQYDYFTATLKPGQAVSLQVSPVPKCLTISGNQIQEKQSTYCLSGEGFRVALMDKGGKELLRTASKSVDRHHESRRIEIGGEGPASYYLVVGSPLGDMHRDHEFQIATREFGDIGTDRDAGDTVATAIPISPGLYEENRISPADKMDMFKVNVPAGSTLKVAVTPKQNEGVYSLEFEVLGELGEVFGGKGSIRNGESGVYESQPLNSAQVVYIRVTAKWYTRIAVPYSLGVAIKSAAAAQPGASRVLPPQAVPPPAPTTVPQAPEAAPPAQAAPEVPQVPAAQATGFPKWLALVTGIFTLFAIVIVLISIWKKKRETSRFAKGLGWYEIVASAVGVGLGIYLVTIMTGSKVAVIFLLSLFLAIGGLGILAGGMLISGRSARPSFWWGLTQLPWLALNLHWVQFEYYCAFLFGLPIHFSLKFVEKLKFLYGINVSLLSADLNLSAYFTTSGEGFEIGLGVNLVAALFLILLWLSQRKSSQA